MKNIKQVLSIFMVAVMVLCSLGYTPRKIHAQEMVPEEPAGWYLTDYKLLINKKSTIGTYTDRVNIYNAEDLEMEGMESELENDIILNYGRYSNTNDSYIAGYSQMISWDSPEDYYAEGTLIDLTNVSNLELSHKSWSCRSISARFNIKTVKDTYDYKFFNSEGKDQFPIGSEDIAIKTQRAIPKAVRGDVAHLIINFDNSTYSDSQAIYTYVWKAPTSIIKAKTYDTKVNKKGWYLTGYSYEDKSKAYSESHFLNGELCIDTKTIYDGNGDITKSKFLENDIYVYDERYINTKSLNDFIVGVRYQIKWDSPVSYVAQGDSLKIEKLSNVVLTTTDTWTSPTVHMYAKTDKYTSDLFNTEGKNWIAATGETSLSSKTPVPEGIDGQKLTLTVAINNIGEGTYTYTWKTGELSKPSLKKSTITLYLSGAKKKLTYKIALNNSTGYKVTYKSRKISVATVSKTGTITAKKEGTANVTVTFKAGTKTYTKTIKVVVKKN